MRMLRVVARAWAAFIGAVAFAYGFVQVVPPLPNGVLDTGATWAVTAIGAAAGLAVAWLAGTVSASLRTPDASPEDSLAPSALARS